MKTPLALALLVLCDTSSRRPMADPSRFELLRSFSARASSLSPAGNVFALYAGNSVTLFDVRTDRETFRLAGHNGNIHDSGWSRDGRVYATSGYDGTVRAWEVATGRTLASIAAHAGYA
jgi:WD40 repeat protein